MQILIVWIILLSLWICSAPLAHPETVALTEEIKPEKVTTSQDQDSSAAGLFQQSLSEIVREVGIENPLVSVKKTAEGAARSVGRSLGLYIRGQYQLRKNEDILQRFDSALADNLAGLQLTPDERRRIVQKIQDNYIQDAESGKSELDQQNFRDLPKIIKKEYSEIELARTPNGNVPTYDTKGMLKTLWAVEKGMLHGPAVTYYSNGEIKFIDFYDNGRKVNRKKFDEEGKLLFEQNYSYAMPPAPPEMKAPIKEPETQTKVEAPAPLKNETPEVSSNHLEVPFKEIQPAE